MSVSEQNIGEEIFQSFCDGHEQGFALLFNAWHLPVCYFAFSMLGDMVEAEDVVSDNFVKLWEKRDCFDSTQACKSFLYTSVRNQSINIIRHRRVVATMQKQISFSQNRDFDFLDQLIHAELAANINDALESLPAECKKVFHLLYSEGKSNQEAADILQLSINTIKAQRQRGLHLLRKKIMLFFLLTFIFN